MDNEIRQIIQEASILKSNGKSSKEIAEFVHIELGKLIIYDNNYSIGFEYDLSQNIEGQKSKTSETRQEKILSQKSSIKSKSQVCKGMAEIYTAILTHLGIDVKVIAVQSKEEVEGEYREDGSIIDVPGIYSANFDSNFEIQLGENEKSNDNPIGHYYTIIKLEEGEFIQDFLTENALTRIKIGEAQTSDDIPGFHRKEEHRKRTNTENDRISEIYVKRIREELHEYMQGKDDSKVFDFIFEKLNEHIDEFGFEEAKDFVMMYAQSIIPRGMIKEAPIPVNLLKEDEENCEVLCVYRYGEKNYLLRGGQTTTNLPIGEVSNIEIQKAILQGFIPRKLEDAKELQNMQIESIIENNNTINKKIEQIIELRRMQRTPFEIDGKIDAQIQKIFEMETKKCLELYKIEFPNYQCQGKEGISFKEGKETADCYGGIDGLQVTSGMQKFIDNVVMPTMKKLGYSINENGIACFEPKANELHEPTSTTHFPQKYIGSTRDQMDYFASLFAKNGIDMDWVLDALPHEAMHTFGVIGGNTFLKEGITEELTREICEKYGIHMSPTSHTQEAEFVRKLEMVVGREQVIESGMWTGKFKEKHFREIMENNPDISFEELSEIFELLKYEPTKLEKDVEARDRLEKFSENHPEIIEILSEKVSLYREEDYSQRYTKVAETFDDRLGLKSGSFFKYAEILDNFYSLTGNHKTDPNFYRDVYSLSLNELQDGYHLFNGKELSDNDRNILSRIETLFEELSQENSISINGFEDLMSPINEYVKEKGLEFNIGYSGDYLSILAIQQEEMGILDEIIKMYEKQNSDKKYTIDIANVIAVAKNATVVDEKENAMEVRAREEQDRKDELKQANSPNLE